MKSIQKDKRDQVKKVVRSISATIPEQKIQKLSKKSSNIWNTVRKYIQLDVQYIYDKVKQKQVNFLLKSLDQLLNTQQSDGVIQETLKDKSSLYEVLNIIMEQYQEAWDNQQNQTELNIKQKTLVPILQQHMKFGSLSKLNGLFQKKIQQLQKLKKDNKTKTTDDYKNLKQQTQKLFKFREYLQKEKINFHVVDEMILNRIEPDLQKSFISSNEISKIQANDQSLVVMQIDAMSLNESSESVQSILLNVSNHVPQNSQAPKSQLKPQMQRPNQFKKKQTENIPFQSLLSQLQEKQQKRQERQEALEFRAINSRPIINPERIQQRQTQANRFHNQSTAFSYDISQNPLNFEDQNSRNLYYSQQIVKRYITQYRFSHPANKYSQSRQLEVDFIVKNQLNPLVAVLKKIKNSDINKYSKSYQPLESVQIYGSFENKCGFRKISDININLNISGLQQKYMKNYLFNLRDYLSNLIKSNHPLSNIFRSAIFCQQAQQVIVSHKINGQEKHNRKDEKVVNFIYITINKPQFVQSSKFMREILYKNVNQHSEIYHLTNFLHLVFKRNGILEYKDLHHIWFVSNPQQKQKKEKSTSKFVHMSIYALHMMIIFYLQKSNQISLVYKDKNKKSYCFKQIKLKSLYQNLVEFLSFYSINGDYRRLYSTRQCIDVVQRTQRQTQQIAVQLQIQQSKLESMNNSFLFAFIHPYANQLIELSKLNKVISFQIKTNSQQEKLFYKKIDQLLEKATRINPNDNSEWNPQIMFEYDQEES